MQWNLSHNFSGDSCRGSGGHSHHQEKNWSSHQKKNHRENLPIGVTLIPTQLGDEAAQAQVKAGWVIAPLAGASPAIRF